jgi:hypothetical protein
MPPRRSLRALARAATLTALVCPAAAGNFGPGASGLEDPYFPDGGNGGYDVQHYSLILEYDPADDVLQGTAISASFFPACWRLGVCSALWRQESRRQPIILELWRSS